MKTVYTAQAPEAIGPYSQAIISGNLVFTSGQIAINPQTGKVEKTDIEGQTVQVLENLKRLEADDFPVVDIDPDKLKNLLGNLYMEMLFPHNERDTFMDMMGMDNKPLFDKKA